MLNIGGITSFKVTPHSETWNEAVEIVNNLRFFEDVVRVQVVLNMPGLSRRHAKEIFPVVVSYLQPIPGTWVILEMLTKRQLFELMRVLKSWHYRGECNSEIIFSFATLRGISK